MSAMAGVKDAPLLCHAVSTVRARDRAHSFAGGALVAWQAWAGVRDTPLAGVSDMSLLCHVVLGLRLGLKTVRTVLATLPVAGRSISISTTSPSITSVSSFILTPIAFRNACRRTSVFLRLLIKVSILKQIRHRPAASWCSHGIWLPNNKQHHQVL